LLSADNISLPDNKYRFTVCQDVTEQTIVEAIQTQQLNFSNAYNKIAEVIISNNTSSDILKTTNSIIRNVLKIDNSLICNVSFENNKIQYLSDSFKKDYQDFISLFEENFSFESFKKSLAEIRNNQHWIESHVNKRNDYFQHEGSSDIIHIISGIKSLLWYPFAFYKDGYYLLILNQIAKQRIFSNTELVFIKSIVKLVNLALLKIKLLDKIKLNEISLFEKEYNLRDSQQISQIGCWEYDNSNHIMRWSDETFRVLGYKPQRFKPTLELFFNSIHKDDLELVEKSIHKSWNSNESLVIDIRIVIDGRIKIMKLHAEIIYDGILKSYKWVGTIQDITEKKKTEELLKNTIIHLRQLRLYNEKVREDERLNISRELHDDLGQALTAVNIEIGLINTKTSDSVLNDKIKTISNLVDDTIGKVQKLTMQLRPVMIDDLGLASAMEWYIAEFEQRNKITVLQQLDTEIEVSSDIAIHIFRITQESLTNIARHAKASQVIIWLNKTDDFIFLRITDNGIGITDNQIRSKKSFGIISMKERMISLGGCFDIYGYESGGSVINIFLPLH
jgi:PAS domain S-box-containing protein